MDLFKQQNETRLTFVDMGANVGMYSTLIAIVFQAEIFAFEPIGANLHRLRRTFFAYNNRQLPKKYR